MSPSDVRMSAEVLENRRRDLSPPAPRDGTAYLDWEPASAAVVDRIQALLGALPQPEAQLTHQFTPGLYIRTLVIPKDCVLVTKIHKSEHPFILQSGRASVWEECSGVQHLTGPHLGVTTPGTRRIWRTYETDCVLTTFHPTTETDPEKIVEQITLVRDLDDLTAGLKALLATT